LIQERREEKKKRRERVDLIQKGKVIVKRNLIYLPEKTPQYQRLTSRKKNRIVKEGKQDANPNL